MLSSRTPSTSLLSLRLETQNQPLYAAYSYDAGAHAAFVICVSAPRNIWRINMRRHWPHLTTQRRNIVLEALCCFTKAWCWLCICYMTWCSNIIAELGRQRRQSKGSKFWSMAQGSWQAGQTGTQRYYTVPNDSQAKSGHQLFNIKEHNLSWSCLPFKIWWPAKHWGRWPEHLWRTVRGRKPDTFKIPGFGIVEADPSHSFGLFWSSMDLTLVSKMLEQSINVNSIPFQALNSICHCRHVFERRS